MMDVTRQIQAAVVWADIILCNLWRGFKIAVPVALIGAFAIMTNRFRGRWP